MVIFHPLEFTDITLSTRLMTIMITNPTLLRRLNPMSESISREEQIVNSRMKLRERFLKKMAQTPAISDEKPMGTGPINRHGMPKLPTGQTETAPGKWPVLDLDN